MAGSPDGPGGGESFLVLGLGNPGPRYEATRHNLGFLVVDALVRSTAATLREGPGPFRLGGVRLGERGGFLAKPLTYMNRSGIAARALLERFPQVPLSRLLVACDDLDLPLGRIRFRRGGGDGGHNGLRSLIEELGSRDFPRLRLGIGRPPAGGTEDVIDWVLEEFVPEERETVAEVVARGAEGVRLFVHEGIEAAMNRFNAV